MQTIQQLFLALLRAQVLDGSAALPKAVDFEAVDFASLFDLARTHDCIGLIYAALRQAEIEIPAPYDEAFACNYFATIQQAARRESCLIELDTLFEQNRIAYIPLKGAALAPLYPCPELRTMGDVDWVIRPRDRQRAHALLLDHGFAATRTHGGVWSYRDSADKLYLELHTKLFEEEISAYTRCLDYFNDPFSLTVDTPQGLRLTLMAGLLYALAHLAKHVSTSGCGVRQFLDLAVLLRAAGTGFDWDQWHLKLEALGLARFAQTALALTHDWFGIPKPAPAIDTALLSAMKSYILQGGTFGAQQYSIAEIALRSEMKKTGKPPSVLLSVRVFLRKLFPPRALLRELYSYYAKCPVLLPVAFCNRCWDRLTKRPKQASQTAAGLFRQRKFARQKYAFMKKIGL